MALPTVLTSVSAATTLTTVTAVRPVTTVGDAASVAVTPRVVSTAIMAYPHRTPQLAACCQRSLPRLSR